MIIRSNFIRSKTKEYCELCKSILKVIKENINALNFLKKNILI